MGDPYSTLRIPHSALKSGSGQFEPKAASLVHFGLDADGATHALDGFFNNAQPNSGTLVPDMGALEDAPDLRQVIGWNANALVRDTDAHPGRGRGGARPRLGPKS